MPLGVNFDEWRGKIGVHVAQGAGADRSLSRKALRGAAAIFDAVLTAIGPGRSSTRVLDCRGTWPSSVTAANYIYLILRSSFSFSTTLRTPQEIDLYDKCCARPTRPKQRSRILGCSRNIVLGH